VDQANELQHRRARRRLLEGRQQTYPARRLPGGSANAPQALPGQYPAVHARSGQSGRRSIPSDQPIGFADGSDLTGWTYSVYLQDEWRIVPTVTVNFGVRFDAINASTQENQFSPRVNVVWRPSETFTARIGYSRYFTAAAALLQVSAGSIAALAGTVAAPEVTTNDPVKAERADYFDAGVTVTPLPGLSIGLSAYYRSPRTCSTKASSARPSRSPRSTMPTHRQRRRARHCLRPVRVGIEGVGGASRHRQPWVVIEEDVMLRCRQLR